MELDPALSRLGRMVRQRRLALDLSQRDAAVRARISNQTWLNVEAGRGANDRSLVRIERAIGWPPGAVEMILAGGDAARPDAPLDRDQLLAQLAVEDLTSDEIEQVITFVRGLRQARQVS